MTQLLVNAALASAPFALWHVARGAARRRELDLGPTPAAALLTTSLACAGMGLGGEPRAGGALAGIAIAALTDIRTGYIFNPIVAATLALTAGLAFLSGELVDAFAGTCATVLPMFVLWVLSRHRGLGLGDVKLAGILGAGLGTANGLYALAAAFVVGGSVATLLIAARRARLGSHLRFGPYLLAGTLLAVAYHRLNAGVIP